MIHSIVNICFILENNSPGWDIFRILDGRQFQLIYCLVAGVLPISMYTVADIFENS